MTQHISALVSAVVVSPDYNSYVHMTHFQPVCLFFTGGQLNIIIGLVANIHVINPEKCQHIHKIKWKMFLTEKIGSHIELICFCIY